MNGNVYFDLCACIVFAGLYISMKIRNIDKGKANVLIVAELIFGFFASLTSLSSNMITLYCSYSTVTAGILYATRFITILLELFIIITNSFFFYSATGIADVLKRKKLLCWSAILITLAPLILLLSNIVFKQLFFVTLGLNVATTSYALYFYLLTLLVLFKDIVITLILHRYISNRLYYVTFILFAIDGAFLMLQYIYPDSKLFLFVTSVLMYIIVSFIQRPDLLVNPIFDALTTQTFYSSCEKTYKTTASADIVFIKIINYKNIKMYVGQQSYVELLKTISGKIKKIIYKNRFYGDLYYIGHGIYAVKFNYQRNQKLKNTYSAISEFFTREMQLQKFNIAFEAKLCVVNIPSDIDNMNVLKEFCRIFDTLVPEEQRVVYYSEISNSRDFRIKNNIRTIMERAVRENNFEVYYQPIYSTKKKCYVTAEALVRLNDPDYGLIMPAMFIPYAEQNDFIHYIGDYVFESVCKFISSDKFKQTSLEYVAMNLSMAQCLEENFSEKIKRIMDRYGVLPDQIRFEITETIEDEYPEIVSKTIAEISEMGIVFALDGYGIGCSNIKKFSTLPFKIVKLDKTFVRQNEDPVIKIIIRETIGMFLKLDKKVLVEGIENKDLEKEFIEMSVDSNPACAYLQGYLYSKPVPQNELLKLLNA